MTDRAKCGAKKKQQAGAETEYCGQAAGWGTSHPGTGRCKLHGGKSPNGEKAATREGAEQEAQRMVLLAGVDQDPIEHLLESLHLSAALVQVWGAMVSELDETAEEENAESKTRGELGYSEDTNERSPYELNVVAKDRLLALNRHGEAGVHPFVIQYENALERRMKCAKLCIDAGVAERQIRVYEQQAEIAQRAFEATIDALGLSAPDRQKARREYAGHLRLVA